MAKVDVLNVIRTHLLVGVLFVAMSVSDCRRRLAARKAARKDRT